MAPPSASGVCTPNSASSLLRRLRLRLRPRGLLLLLMLRVARRRRGLAQIDVPKPDGIYGYSGDAGNITTPNLAKFASEGLLLCVPRLFTPGRGS